MILSITTLSMTTFSITIHKTRHSALWQWVVMLNITYKPFMPSVVAPVQGYQSYCAFPFSKTSLVESYVQNVVVNFGLYQFVKIEDTFTVFCFCEMQVFVIFLTTQQAQARLVNKGN
jgi:hypothetical protein